MEITPLDRVEAPPVPQTRLAALAARVLTPDILRFLRFAIVGGSGVLVNMAALWLLHIYFGFNLGRSSVLAITLAIVNNFLWNNFWTFGAQGVMTRRVVQFAAISLVGMAINVAVLHLLVALGGWLAPALDPEALVLPSNLVGILTATAWNFFANSRWTWGDA